MALLPRSFQVGQTHRINDAFERTTFGITRAGIRHAGGFAAASACRTVLRGTRCPLARQRIDEP